MVWLCDNCKKEYETKEETLEHEKTCQDTVGSRKRMERKRIELEFQELVEKDRMKNPILAQISDHLWWLALVARLALISMLISVGLSLIFMGDL